jgi:DNA polymerase-3 subunit alpha
MKAHHAAAFLAANLSAVMDDTDKVRQFYEDALANGLQIRPPDVNTSEYRFVPADKSTILYGLGAIRGTGESAIQSIVEARRAGPFRDLFDFCRRVDRRLVNRRAIEAMARAGAFDAVDANRARLLASVGRALEAAEQEERQASQTSLFGEAEAPRGGAHAYVEAAPWDRRQMLRRSASTSPAICSPSTSASWPASRARRSRGLPLPSSAAGWPASSPQRAAR